jgi:hypothetical protein
LTTAAAILHYWLGKMFSSGLLRHYFGLTASARKKILSVEVVFWCGCGLASIFDQR